MHTAVGAQPFLVGGACIERYGEKHFKKLHHLDLRLVRIVWIVPDTVVVAASSKEIANLVNTLHCVSTSVGPSWEL